MSDLIRELPLWLRRSADEDRLPRYEVELLLFLYKRYGNLPEPLTTALFFLSLFVKAGHACLPLERSPDEWNEILQTEYAVPQSDKTLDLETISSHPMVGSTPEVRPLLMEENRLYFYKFRHQELEVAERLNRLAVSWLKSPDERDVAEVLQKHFPEQPGIEPDWPKAAAVLSLRNRLLILSGGPGTGKTTTVTRIIQLLTALSDEPLKVAMAAPTGKAAARMSQSMELMNENGGGDRLSPLTPTSGTVHKLLAEVEQKGLLPASWKRNLPYDLIVIDEASMVDLGMMNRLLEHIGEKSRLILLGDRDQLASVEAGSVLADICRKRHNGFTAATIDHLKRFGGPGDLPESSSQPLEDAIVYLEKSYRFDSESGISALAGAVNRSESDRILQLLDKQTSSDLEFHPFSWQESETGLLFDTLVERLKMASGLKGGDLLDHWSKEVWLTILRRGPFGSDELNNYIERRLRREPGIRMVDGWYHGRPVLITRNDYTLDLYNGDLGVCSHQPESSPTVLFSGQGGVERVVPVHRLRDYDPAYLLTVHKSQGSEFDCVNLLLPDRDTPVLSRELLYTAITRARDRFRLYGGRDLFVLGAERKTERFTGLAGLLYGGNGM